jgi:hypothetical protein
MLPKKANGANFKVGEGEINVRFDADGPSIVHIVCLWGAKPQFGGQRNKLWSSETTTSNGGGATVTIPAGMAMAGTQVTWSGGLIAPGEAHGGLHVTVEQEGGTSEAYTYEYNFSEKDQTAAFYDGLNFA